jgi:NADH:ubiquinone oxidoreductase subunit 2 (subunit N)
VDYTYTAAFALFLSTASAIYYLKLVRFTYFFRDSRSFLLLNEITRPVAYVVAGAFTLNVSFFLWGSDFLLLLCQFQSNFLL